MKREQQEPNDPQQVTINELMSAITATEYPQYILDALNLIQNWMQETLSAAFDETHSFMASFEGSEEEMASHIDNLFERLAALESSVDFIPNTTPPEGKPDAIVVNLTPIDCESGLRTAIDYAALFNRSNSKRVWIVSDTFVFDDVVRYSAHVDALAEQEIALRFILVTPWGWVEMPLSGATVSRRQFLWRTPLRGMEQNRRAE